MTRLSLCLLLLLALTGCSKSTPEHGIVALTPSLAEAVWALDLQKSHPLVAVSPYTTDPRAKNILKLQPNGALETIVALHPDLVLLHPNDLPLAAKLSELDISVKMHAMDSVDDVEYALLNIGSFFDQKQKAQNIAQKMKDEIASNAQKYHRDTPPQALIIIDRLDMRFLQLYTTESPSYIADFVSGCGVSPIAHAKSPWAKLDAEKLIQLNPPNIVFLARSKEDAAEVRTQFVKTYPSLDAVKNGRFFVYDDPDLTIPGPDMPKRQEKLCKFLLDLH